MSLIFDTHAHYDDAAFDEDREELLSGLRRSGVGLVVNASAAARNIPFILELTRRYDFLYAAAGLHPCETYGCGDNMGAPVMRKDRHLQEVLSLYQDREIITPEWTAGEREYQLICAALKDPKVVAVGEIGLDYHYEDTRKDVQQEWFARQIALAREVRKPIIIHSRDAAADTLNMVCASAADTPDRLHAAPDIPGRMYASAVDTPDRVHVAADTPDRVHAAPDIPGRMRASAVDTLDMVRSEQARDVGGIVHCFSYGKEMAAQYLDLGFMIGVGGVVTFKNSKKIKEVVSYLPMDRIVLETDCPYLAPSPFRGKRNDSSMIRYVVQTIAQLKGIPEEEVVRITEENARRVYQLPAAEEI